MYVDKGVCADEAEPWLGYRACLRLGLSERCAQQTADPNQLWETSSEH